MSSRKKGLTWEEHQALGAELQAMRNRLVQLTVELHTAYPLAVANLASGAAESVDKLRCKMDDLVISEHPARETRELIGTYYRPTRRTEEARR